MISRRIFEKRIEKPVITGNGLDEYSMADRIGKGSFGEVFLAKHIDTEKKVAVKKIEKLKVTDEVYIVSERRILACLNFPFIVKWLEEAEDAGHVYLVTELVPGGELFSLLHRVGRMKEIQARFYLAQVVLALEYLHTLGVIYRDLKPENILLDAKGYVKLIDFGFAKRVRKGERSWTLCGTPEYLAPEVILARGYGPAADWWGVGVLLWELVVGEPPWGGPHPRDRWRQVRVYEAVLEGVPSPPLNFSPGLVTLVAGLLERREKSRLGVVARVAEHGWFGGLEWGALWRMEIRAPFLPVSKDQKGYLSYYAWNSEGSAFKKF